MAKTVGTLAYQIVADTRNFTSGMVLTKNELRATKAVMEDTQSPVKRLADSVGGLNTLFGKGAISGTQYAGSLSKLVSEHTAGLPVIGRFTNILSMGHPALIALAAATAGVTVGIAAMSKAISFGTEKISEQYKVLDELINSAEKLGIPVASFQDIAKAAGLADVEMSSATKAVEKMLIAVSRGGSGKFKDAFASLHLDFRKLRAERPEQMLRDILSALEGVGFEADRVKIAQTIFGDTDILRMSAAQIDEASRALEQMGAHLSDLDVSKLNEMDDAFKEMHGSIDAVFQKMAVELAPVLTDIANTVKEIFVDIGSDKSFVETVKELTVGLRAAVLVAKELLEIEKQKAAMAGGFAHGVLGGMVGGTAGALPLSSTYDELEKQIKIADELDKKIKALGADAGIITATPPLKDEATFGLPGGKTDDIYDKKHPVEDMIEKLQEQRRELEYGAEAYQMYLAAKAGADDAWLEEIASLQEAIKAQKDFNKLQTDSKAAIESLKSPFDKAREDIERYAEMLEEGMITPDQFTDLREKRIGDLKSSQKQEEFRNPAQLRGSQEALQTIANAKFGNTNAIDDMAESLRSIDAKTHPDDGVELPVISSFSKG